MSKSIFLLLNWSLLGALGAPIRREPSTGEVSEKLSVKAASGRKYSARPTVDCVRPERRHSDRLRRRRFAASKGLGSARKGNQRTPAWRRNSGVDQIRKEEWSV